MNKILGSAKIEEAKEEDEFTPARKFDMDEDEESFFDEIDQDMEDTGAITSSMAFFSLKTQAKT